jgi:hypothetical protein
MSSIWQHFSYVHVSLLSPQTVSLPDAVLASKHRTRSVRFLHEESLGHVSSAVRLEAAAHATLNAPSDAYLTSITRLAFGLAKPELAGLKRRIVLADPTLDLNAVCKESASYNNKQTLHQA